jgi:hypothetical protein
LSVTLVEKIPLLQAFSAQDCTFQEDSLRNQLNLFD